MLKTSGFTRFSKLGIPPFKTLLTSSTAIRPPLSHSTVNPAICGVTMQFFNFKSVLSFGGSDSSTSKRHPRSIFSEEHYIKLFHQLYLLKL